MAMVGSRVSLVAIAIVVLYGPKAAAIQSYKPQKISAADVELSHTGAGGSRKVNKSASASNATDLHSAQVDKSAQRGKRQRLSSKDIAAKVKAEVCGCQGKKPRILQPDGETSAIVGSMDAANSVYDLTNKTLNASSTSLLTSLDQFADVVIKMNSSSAGSELAANVAIYSGTLRQLIQQAQDEIRVTTFLKQKELNDTVDAIAILDNKTALSFDKALAAVDEVVDKAKTAVAEDDGSNKDDAPVVLRQTHVSDRRAIETDDAHGPFDWITNIFSGEPSLCSKAHSSISSANKSVGKVALALQDLNSTTSKLLVAWSTAVEDAVKQMREEVDATEAQLTLELPAGTSTQVAEGLLLVPTAMDQMLKTIAGAQVRVSVYLTGAQDDDVLPSYEALDKLDAEATGACDLIKEAKASSAAGACGDHHC